MFYIQHNSDNFSIIDCSLYDGNRERIANEIVSEAEKKGITRFISTHPDEDHIHGLRHLDNKIGILNFYCVENAANKEEETDDFKKYCELRDGDKAFNLYQGCSRKWMNQGDEERKNSGINILWPKTDNEHFIDALSEAKNGKNPNNISPIITYTLQDGVKAIWFGDLEKDFLDQIKDEIEFTAVDILFAPHHGRKSGKIPKEILDVLEPKIVIIGESACEDLDYYSGFNTITQNSAGDITLECLAGKIHVYVSNDNYQVSFLDKQSADKYNYYIGTLVL
jgi:beta-lactamase superfamily II metal-dependent hydrolase